MTLKTDVRGLASAARKARSEAERDVARAGIRRVLASRLSQLGPGPGARIAAYEPMSTEPGSIELLAELTRGGYEVIVPMTQPDNDLDWGVWTFTRQARLPLGMDAITTAELILVPAFAVDAAGNRLGRGGGSYDRALARAGAGVAIAAVLFDGEILDEVPTDDWDRPVTAALTPSGWVDLAAVSG